MADTPTPSGNHPKRISLDIWAVALSLLAALLVRANLLPAIKW